METGNDSAPFQSDDFRVEMFSGSESLKTIGNLNF